jgi:NADPH2 dehydrogenase
MHGNPATLAVGGVFSPLTIRGMRLPNRIVMSPMSQKKARPDGCATDWHLVHYGSRAVGGVGLVMIEDCAVRADGRTGPASLSLETDEHVGGLRRVVRFCQEQGAKVGVQLGHAGRKSSLPGLVGPSPLPFASDAPVPRELAADEVARIPADFAAAARRAIDAGADALELHGSHGYLLHQFLSPLSNRRTDEYGGSAGARLRLLRETFKAIRAASPEAVPLFVRIAVSDEAPGGLSLADGVDTCRTLRDLGADAFVPTAGRIADGAEAVENVAPYAREVRIHTSAVTVLTGGIKSADDASHAIGDGVCDLVAVGRLLLDNPYWVRNVKHTMASRN